MKSDKQRILEAYSADLKAMNGITEDKSSDVKKWIVEKPRYIAEQHNIVDAYALLAEDDNYRQNKMRILNEQIILKGKISKGESAYKHQFSNWLNTGYRIQAFTGRQLSKDELIHIGKGDHRARAVHAIVRRTRGADCTMSHVDMSFIVWRGEPDASASPLPSES